MAVVQLKRLPFALLLLTLIAWTNHISWPPTLETKEEKKILPLAMLHMGPGKTGTSSIQDALRDNNILESLDEDGWDASLIRGTSESKTIGKCIFYHQDCKSEGWRNALNATVSNGAERGKDLLMSNEAMAHFDLASNVYWKQLSLLLKKHYRVHAILAYRRYFEWVPSYYMQQYKIKGPYGKRTINWPSQGGVIIPSFVEFWNQMHHHTELEGLEPRHNQWDEETGLPIHKTLKIKSRLEAQSISVTIMNYHSGDVTETFFCSALPHAHRTCQKIKNRNAIRKNKSTDIFDYDIIAVAAKEAGLLRDDVGRSSSRAHIKRFLVTTNQTVERDLPLKCLEKSKESLLRQISYEAEEQLMPSLLSSFNTSFAAAIEKHKFCNVDATILLQNKTWRSFLSSIGSSNG